MHIYVYMRLHFSPTFPPLGFQFYALRCAYKFVCCKRLNDKIFVSFGSKCVQIVQGLLFIVFMICLLIFVLLASRLEHNSVLLASRLEHNRACI